MKKYMEMLQQCPLFADISPQNLLAMTSCLGSQVVRYAKGDVIFEEGSPARHMGLLLSGGAQIVKEYFSLFCTFSERSGAFSVSAILLCREKYGNASGKHQKEERIPLMNEKEVSRKT